MKKLYSNSPTPELEVWQKEGEETKLVGKYGIALISRHYIHPVTGGSAEYVFARKKPGATILPLTTEQELIMVRQFKQAMDSIVLEFPAGLMNGGDPAATAKAELLAETGCEAERISILLGGGCMFAPRKIETTEWSFAAVGCRIVKEPNLEPGEILEVISVTQEEFWSLVAKGGISSAATLITAYKALQAGILSLDLFTDAMVTAG